MKTAVLARGGHTLFALLFLLFLLGLPGLGYGQVGIGTPTPSAKAALEIAATNKGLLIPRLTGTQRAGIGSVPQGLLVYQTDAPEGFWYYGGGSWLYLNPSATLALPYAGSAASNGPAFAATNTGAGVALSGTAGNSSFSLGAVVGQNTDGGGAATGVLGLTAGGYGVRGAASATGGYGVAGMATDGRGLSGSASSGTGVYGTSATGVAVQGEHKTGDRGRAAQFTSSDAANDSTAVYISTPGDRPALRAVNTAASAQAAIRGVKQSAGADGAGVEGVITAGASGNAAAVRGLDHSGGGGSSGLLGLTANGYGVRGVASAAGGYGVSGSATTSYGVIGGSSSGVGTYGGSTSGAGVQGVSSSGYGVQASSVSNAAVYASASNNSTTNAAIVGTNTDTGGSATGVLGLTASGYGVRGVASANGYGVQGVSSSSYGVVGSSTSGVGVYGSAAASGATIAGVYGTNSNSFGIGVLGTTTSGYGVRGDASGTSGYGLTGTASGSSGIGVLASVSGAATAVKGQTSGTGRAAVFSQSNAASAANAVEIMTTGTGAALNITHPTITTATTPYVNGAGVLINDQGGINSVAINAFGLRVGGANVNGVTNAVSIEATGRVAASTASSQAVFAAAFGSDPSFGALTAIATGGTYAGRFLGPVIIQGSLAKSAGSFKIDHPLDPANKYLSHSFVESPDMMNVYNGNVTLDAQGEATVSLPDWFEALNRDFRYQLTSLGAFMPLFIKEKVSGNKFRIGGGMPGGEASWQVTGIRHDAYADAHRIPIEEAKEPANRGQYLTPAVFGQPTSLTIGAKREGATNDYR